jgi:hypothetical protein
MKGGVHLVIICVINMMYYGEKRNNYIKCYNITSEFEGLNVVEKTMVSHVKLFSLYTIYTNPRLTRILHFFSAILLYRKKTTLQMYELSKSF